MNISRISYSSLGFHREAYDTCIDTHYVWMHIAPKSKLQYQITREQESLSGSKESIILLDGGPA